MHGWAKQGELQMWLHTNNVKFTPGGSVLASNGVVLKVSVPDIAEKLIKNTSGEIMATHILSVYSGHTRFTSTTLEAIFWKEVINRMSKEFDLFIQPNLIPTYIRDIIKYPGDGDSSLPT